MRRILSSAFGLRRSNRSRASYKVAAGWLEPGEKTASDDCGTFWINSDVAELRIRRPSSSVTRCTEGGWSYLFVSDHQCACAQSAYRKQSPDGPTTTTLPPHASTTALSPHQAAPSGIPPASSSPSTSASATSERFRPKSAETTHNDPVPVSRARKRPFGEGRICEKGPRDMR